MNLSVVNVPIQAVSSPNPSPPPASTRSCSYSLLPALSHWPNTPFKVPGVPSGHGAKGDAVLLSCKGAARRGPGAAAHASNVSGMPEVAVARNTAAIWGIPWPDASPLADLGASSGCSISGSIGGGWPTGRSISPLGRLCRQSPDPAVRQVAL